MNSRKLIFLGLFIFFISCDKATDKVIYDFGEGVTAEWFQDSGVLDFSGGSEGLFLIHKYRNEIDTLNHKEYEYFEFKVPGKHYFQLFDGNKTIGKEVIFNRRIHSGIGHICSYNTPDAPYKKLNALNDGIVGYMEFIGPEWVGWKNKDAVVEYDFLGDMNINYVTVSYRDEIDKGIYPPQYVLVEGSVDGINFFPKQRKNVDPPGFPLTAEQIPIRATFQKIRVTIKNYSTSGDFDSWLLIDEVAISEY
jgi:hypothetical protein